jgi:hypothetical protein
MPATPGKGGAPRRRNSKRQKSNPYTGGMRETGGEQLAARRGKGAGGTAAGTGTSSRQAGKGRGAGGTAAATRTLGSKGKGKGKGKGKASQRSGWLAREWHDAASEAARRCLERSLDDEACRREMDGMTYVP